MNKDEELEFAKKEAERINARRIAAGADPLGRASKEPDIPACDYCGKPYSANLSCSACQCVFYCTKECQRAHWKQQKPNGGHRSECATMKEHCDKVGESVVRQMNNRDDEYGRVELCYMRVDNDMLHKLDGAGAYRAAVAAGLHDAIRQLMIDDKAQVLSRYASPNPMTPRVCYTNSVVAALFRGQRVEGKHSQGGQQQQPRNPSFGCIDGQRIKGYVKSHPDAFQIWWEASLEVYKMPLDDDVWKLGQQAHFQAHMRARDLWAAWSLVFVDKRASKAILLPSNDNDNKDAAAYQAKYLAATLHKTLSRRWSVNDNRDETGCLEGLLNQATALIHERLQEFKVPCSNFVKLLKLGKGANRKMYENTAVPVAKAMIVKGGNLTSDEFRSVVKRP